MVQCPFCMSDIDDAATVCPHCQAVKQKDGWRSADQMARNSRTGLILSVVAIVLVIVIGGIAWNARQAANRRDLDRRMDQAVECIDAAGTPRYEQLDC